MKKNIVVLDDAFSVVLVKNFLKNTGYIVQGDQQSVEVEKLLNQETKVLLINPGWISDQELESLVKKIDRNKTLVVATNSKMERTYNKDLFHFVFDKPFSLLKIKKIILN